MGWNAITITGINTITINIKVVFSTRLLKCICFDTFVSTGATLFIYFLHATLHLSLNLAVSGLFRLVSDLMHSLQAL